MIKKSIKKTNAATSKLGLALANITSLKLKAIREEIRKKEKIVEKLKIEAIVSKYYKNKGRISLYY